MADVTPILPFLDVIDAGPRRRIATVHSHPKYYRRPDLPGGWGETHEAFRLDGQSVVATEGVHSLRVGRDGLVVASHCGHDLTFRLRGVVGLAADGTESVAREIDLATWALDLKGIDRGVVAWDGPQGIRYEVRYVADQVRDRFVLTDQGRDWIRARLPAGAARFGLAFDCSLPPGLARTAEGKVAADFDTEAPVLLAAGTIRQWLRPSALIDPRLSPLDPSAAGWRERWSLKGGHLVQAVPLAALAAAAELNTVVTYQQGTSGYSGCIDNYLDAAATTTNRDTAGLNLGPYNVSQPYRPILQFDLSALSGVTSVNSATLGLYLYGSLGSPSNALNARVLRAWSETTSCWNNASTGVAWGTAGCNNTSTDRTALGNSTALDTTVGWHYFPLTDWATDWLVDGDPNYGFVLAATNEVNQNLAKFYDSEYATTANRPKVTIDYETGGGEELFVAVTETLGLGEIGAKATGKSVADVLGLGDERLKGKSHVHGESLEILGQVAKSAAKAISEDLALSEAMAREVGKMLAETVAVGEAQAKAAAKVLAETLGLDEDYALDLVEVGLQKVVTETLALGESLAKGVGKAAVERLVLEELLPRLIGKSVAEAMAIGESVAAVVAQLIVGKLRAINRSRQRRATDQKAYRARSRRDYRARRQD